MLLSWSPSKVQVKLGQVLRCSDETVVEFVDRRGSQCSGFCKAWCGSVICEHDRWLLGADYHVADSLNGPDETSDFKLCGPIASFRGGEELREEEDGLHALPVDLIE